MRRSRVSTGVKVPCTSVKVVTLHGLLRNSTDRTRWQRNVLKYISHASRCLLFAICKSQNSRIFLLNTWNKVDFTSPFPRSCLYWEISKASCLSGFYVRNRIYRSQQWQSDWRQSMVDSHLDGLVPNGSSFLAIFLNLFISWFTCYQLLQHFFPSLSYTLSRSVSSAASLAHPRKERVQRSCKIGASPEGLRVLIWIIAVGISGFDNLSLLVRLLIVFYSSTYISRMPRKTVNPFEEIKVVKAAPWCHHPQLSKLK